ncbi:hypothetical protein [Microbacterium oxydans]|uniref:hypothetical protein n=1 Tax=Microbacterium oxydans TaxID=82380 RepID=UPI0022B187D6|nr:hypothetical protein [Microbacterium oxydans]MCZ4301358.1 hypothetical protein [Microbacterium oxydans]
MANTFNLDINNLAQTAAKLVGMDFNLAGLISRDVEADFAPGRGSTVRVAVPAAIPTRTKGIYDRTTPLVADDLNEQFIEVELKDHLYNVAVLSAGDFSLDITDFGRQVLLPQTRAIAAKVEALTAATMSATPETTSIPYAAATPAKAFTAARRVLRANGVPGDSILRAAVGSSVYADLLDAPVGQGFDADGKVRGFEVVESTRLADSDIVAFVPEAFTLVARAPMVPAGAAHGASTVTPVLDNERGAQFAVTAVVDYDSTVAADRSLVSTFAAVQAMPLPVDNEDGTVTLLAHGGAVRIDTAA